MKNKQVFGAFRKLYNENRVNLDLQQCKLMNKFLASFLEASDFDSCFCKESDAQDVAVLEIK